MKAIPQLLPLYERSELLRCAVVMIAHQMAVGVEGPAQVEAGLAWH